MRETLEKIKKEALEALSSPSAQLEELRIRFLGKKGELTAVLRGMGKLAPEEILASDISEEQRNRLQKDTGVSVTDSNIQAASASSRVAQSAMIIMLGYFSRTRARKPGAVSSSPRGVSVQSMEMMSLRASTHSSTSRMVMVMRPE